MPGTPGPLRILPPFLLWAVHQSVRRETPHGMHIPVEYCGSEIEMEKKLMQLTSRSLLFAACAAAVACLSLTGCKTGDRTTGRYIDDRTVTHRVKSNIDHDANHKFPDINVETFAGVVQLSGFVDAKEQITVAGQIASRTEGVRQVINSLVLKPQPHEAMLSPTGSPTGTRYDSDYNPQQPLPQPSSTTTTTTTTTNNYPFRR